ncbi:unnamed protein product [Amoebophrya sp. A120]|nr:unnamed protein product [Amoebophrya sp. A120]|eukprot:GSA120T00008457001.1
MGKCKTDLHQHLTGAVNWSYDDKQDRYFAKGEPTWDLEKRITKGEKQGALPSSSVEEFRKKDAKKAEDRLQRLAKMQEEEGVKPEKEQESTSEKVVESTPAPAKKEAEAETAVKSTSTPATEEPGLVVEIR